PLVFGLEPEVLLTDVNRPQMGRDPGDGTAGPARRRVWGRPLGQLPLGDLGLLGDHRAVAKLLRPGLLPWRAVHEPHAADHDAGNQGQGLDRLLGGNRCLPVLTNLHHDSLLNERTPNRYFRAADPSGRIGAARLSPTAASTTSRREQSTRASWELT